ncbi:MAG: Xaa-Pro peptidase family protein [Tannerellaceae bacterium]|jgi:Xaa-Pro aminopeptidase|nr:Xaa-Pro peptidase family protein [Tannerellaceae bacterium]
MMQNELACDAGCKWRRLQQAMREIDAGGCLLSADVNLYYVTGRIYNGYFYLPAEGDPWFFVKRPVGLSGEHVVYIRKPEQMKEIFADRGLSMPDKLLLEADELCYNEYERLKAIFNPLCTANATTLIRTHRMIKTPWEIEQFRISARMHALTYAAIPACYRPGMTDLDFQYEIEHLMRRNGSIGIFRTFGSNMDIFQGSILTGDNAGAPSPFDFALGGAGAGVFAPLGANGTLLEDGMAVMVDMAGNYTAYITDMTRTFSIGKLPELACRAHQVSRLIQEETERIARPGISCAELYRLALAIVSQEKLEPYFMGTKQQAKFVGHGIGIQINELPVLTPRSKDILQPNMVFALEPKFVIPGVGAVGIENSFLVTETGIEKVTQAEEDIINLTS